MIKYLPIHKLTGKDPIRKFLGFVEVTPKTTTATDSFVMGTVNSDVFFSPDLLDAISEVPGGKIYIHRDNWPALKNSHSLKLESYKAPANFVIRGRTTKGGRMFMFPVEIEMQYPEAEKIYNQYPKKTKMDLVRLDAKHLRRVQKALGLIHVSMHLHGNNKSILIEGRDEPGDHNDDRQLKDRRGLVMPIMIYP